jgi:pimeloyl-ACP methyl ester carboxylesterase
MRPPALPPLPSLRSWQRTVRGCTSAARAGVFPLGRWWPGGLSRLSECERLDRGLVIVLPGIEGRSFFAFDIAHGLCEGGTEAAVEIFDWTTGLAPLFLYHLRASGRNQRRAAAVAQRIAAYQDDYPGRPVHLVGHSGGGGIALLALGALPAGRRVASVILLAPAVSPQFAIHDVLPKTERGIWNFWSPLDALFLAAGTLVFGTLDGRHAIAAGAQGFAATPEPESAAVDDVRPRLHQLRYDLSLCRQFHLGGHFGCANRVFISETVAPLLK